MFAMFKQLFAAITVLFMAFEKQANAVNHLSTWAEESAGAFADEARIMRQAKANNMLKELKVSEKQLANESTKPVAIK
jgi:hypothetical protein